MSSVGGAVERSGGSGCCDICSVCPAGRLRILGGGTVASKKKPRRAVRQLDVSRLEDMLKKARDDYVAEHHAYRMVGVELVCPTSAIEKLSKEAKYISSMDDFPLDISIRSDLKERFHRVILSCSSSSLPSCSSSSSLPSCSSSSL